MSQTTSPAPTPVPAPAPTAAATKPVDLPSLPMSESRRAGLTDTQWLALTEAQRNQYRAAFPDPNPPGVVTIPSPPDPHNLTALAITDHPHHIAAAIETDEADTKFVGLPNTPGGRNHPNLSHYDPSRKATA